MPLLVSNPMLQITSTVPTLFDVVIHLLLLLGVVLLFCTTLFVVSEITIPENTYTHCEKLNKVVAIEWGVLVGYTILLLLGSYFWFALGLLPLSFWHVLRHVQNGAVFTPAEIHRPKFRDNNTTFYSVKLALYSALFLMMTFNTGVTIVDYSNYQFNIPNWF